MVGPSQVPKASGSGNSATNHACLLLANMRPGQLEMANLLSEVIVVSQLCMALTLACMHEERGTYDRRSSACLELVTTVVCLNIWIFENTMQCCAQRVLLMEIAAKHSEHKKWEIHAHGEPSSCRRRPQIYPQGWATAHSPVQHTLKRNLSWLWARAP